MTDYEEKGGPRREEVKADARTRRDRRDGAEAMPVPKESERGKSGPEEKLS